ncbi:MAG TPA: FtsX-like permease family protein [Thermoleophilaceae bacterium]
MTVFGMRLRAMLRFYWWRVRKHPMQEIFAGLGIAVGVALVYAVQVANTSITGSADQVVRGVVGDARVQLAARSSEGFAQSRAEQVQRLAGVRRSAPLLRVRAAVVGPDGRRSIELMGATPRLAEFGGALTRNFGNRGLRLSDAIALPSAVARSVGANAGQKVSLLAGGRERRVVVGAVLGRETIGPLAESQAAIAPLRFAQQVTGRSGRVTQVVVQPEAGRQEQVERSLRRIAAGMLTVGPADADLQMLRQAAEPNDRSTSLFAAISAMVGFLFALNAMLITVGERRRFIADLRVQGFATKQVLTIVAFEALMLGAVASIVGLALGELLSRVVFDEVPEYLAFAFPIGSQRVVHWSALAMALGGGILAALLASLRPVLDLRRGRPLDSVFRELGEPGEAIGAGLARTLFVLGAVTVAITTVVALAMPQATVIGGLTLALAALLVMPMVVSYAARWIEEASGRSRQLSMLVLAMIELRGTTMRTIALAALGALAMFGSVAIGGARGDLVNGFDRHTREWLSNADVWVTTGGEDLMIDSFKRTPRMRALASEPGVEAVRFDRGGLLDVAGRRLWAIGRPAGDRVMIPPSQLLQGDLDQATSRLRAGGWVAVSDALAQSQGLGVGDKLTLPAPAGKRRFRVAAVTTNLGWGPGAVILNAADFQRAWHTREPTAIEVDLKPGVSPAHGKQLVAQALGSTSALRVQTRAEREAQYFALGRQGLTRLSQIALLLLITAALAVACALVATIWQRRTRLAALKIQGLDTWQLWRSLLYETGFIVLIGCLVGATLGIYGHFLAGRYLQYSTSYAAPFSVGVHGVFLAAGLVAGLALVVSAIPGYAAAQVPMRASFQE